jgi:MFS family permease
VIALPIFVCALVGFPPDAPRPVATAGTDASAAVDGYTVADQVKFAVFALLCGGMLMSGPLFLPFRLREIGIADSRILGNVLMTTAIASIVSGYIYGRVRAYISAMTTFVVAFSIMAVGLCLIGLANGLVPMIAAMAVAGLGQGLAVPNYWSFAAASAPERCRARIMGFAKSGMYAGPLIAQLVVEPVISRTDYAVGFGVLAGIAVIFALFFVSRLVSERAGRVPA